MVYYKLYDVPVLNRTGLNYVLPHKLNNSFKYSSDWSIQQKLQVAMFYI